LPREKSIARHKNMITPSSSSSDADDYESLGVDQEHTWGTYTDLRCRLVECDATTLRWGPFTTRFIYLQVWGLVKWRPFNVSLFSFHNDMFNHFWKKIISFNECYFRFTNIEVARAITLAFKSLMKIPLFQWSQVFKHPEWKSQVGAWFSRFKVCINLNILLC